MKPLSDAFRSESHHRKLWQAQGKCVGCNDRPRDLICDRCGEPFCAPCLKIHGKTHLREKYIEKIARGEVHHGVPAEEWAEAMAIRARWAAETGGQGE